MSLPTGFHKLNDRDYFEIELPSSSQTKILLEGTNAHLAHSRAQPREENDAFAVGAYTHALLLQPEQIENDFIVIAKLDRRTKEGKAAWESAQRRAELSGARIITDEQVTLGRAMADSVLANDAASRILSRLTLREITVIGDIGGRPAKAKVDGIATIDHATIIVDIKTAQSIHPRTFATAAATYGYYHQAAFYRRLVEQTVESVQDVIVIAVEKDAPHLCAVYRLPDAALEIADRRIPELVDRWWYVAHGDCTGYAPTIHELTPPTWWMNATND
jgi:hypothetical protein